VRFGKTPNWVQMDTSEDDRAPTNQPFPSLQKHTSKNIVVLSAERILVGTGTQSRISQSLMTVLH
jgi:hypothetical protein